MLKRGNFTYIELLMSGKSSRPSGCAPEGQQHTAQGRAERSEAAPWVTWTSGLVAPTGRVFKTDVKNLRIFCL